MATLTLKDCKEFMIFCALTENERFVDACKALMDFDKTHPNEKVFKEPKDKEILRQCFNECRQALLIAFPRDEQPDFNNLAHLNRLQNVFNQQLPRRCQKSQNAFETPFKGKIGMGQIFLKHMDYLRDAGLPYYKSLISEQKREDSKRTYEQARVDSYRPLERGYGEKKVFSGKATYKTQQEVIRDRIAEERRKGRL